MSTALAARLTSRRGRDAMVIVASLVALGAQGIRFIRFTSVDLTWVERIANVVRWSPPGMLGQAVFDAHRDRVGVAMAELVIPIAVIPLLLAAWGAALDRANTVFTGRSAVTGARSRRQLPLLFDRLPFVRPSPWGAVASKELRYILRDPRRKVMVLNSFLVGAAVPIFIGVRSGGSSPHVVLLGSLAGYVSILASMNQFGFDGGALWTDIVAGQTLYAELLGKNVASAITIVPVVLVGAVVLAAFTGGWALVPAAVLLGIAGTAVGLAVANITSVRLPQAMPESSSPFARSRQGAGCATAMAGLFAMAIQGLLLSPIAIAAAVAVQINAVWLVFVAPASVAYGFLMWHAGTRMAVDFTRGREAELLAAVDPRRA